MDHIQHDADSFKHSLNRTQHNPTIHHTHSKSVHHSNSFFSFSLMLTTSYPIHRNCQRA